MSGAEPWTGSNSEGKHRSGSKFLEVECRWAAAGRSEIGQDIAKEIRGHDHVEAIRIQHELRGQDIDVIFVPTDIGIISGHRDHAHAIGHR